MKFDKTKLKEIIIAFVIISLVISTSISLFFAISNKSKINYYNGKNINYYKSSLQVDVYYGENNQTNTQSNKYYEEYIYDFNQLVDSRDNQVIDDYNVNSMFYHIKDFHGLMGQLIRGVYLWNDKKWIDEGMHNGSYYSWKLMYFNIHNQKYEPSPVGISNLKTIIGNQNKIQLIWSVY